MTPSSPESAIRRGTNVDENGEVLGEPSAKRQRRDGDDQPLSGGSQRRQAACQPCRLRKVKCDKQRPCCGLCKLSGQVCEYIGDAPDKLTLETAVSTLLERLDNLQKEFESVKDMVRQNGKSPESRPKVQAVPNPIISTISPNVTHTLPDRSTSTEASRDFLQIPPHRASADTVLRWEIFLNKYPPNALIGGLFCSESDSSSLPQRRVSNPHGDLITNPTGLTPLDEEQIPMLIDRFLQNVHTKNPILDVEALVKHGRKCANHGLGWDVRSCLVLLACALGSVAKPYERSIHPTSSVVLSPTSDTSNSSVGGNPGNLSSSKLWAKELQQGDSCFTLACRRLGSFKYSMLGAQCHFFAGVYLMYTLRPIMSWHYFIQASIFCQMYLRMNHGISGDFSYLLEEPQRSTSVDRKTRRLEQSLYWSCFKSECEFRVELPLHQSEISLGEYPDLFPSPPSPVNTDSHGAAQPAGVGRAPSVTSTASLNQISGYDTASIMNDEASELRQHAARLCNEEESWYYYLTEIALRRIGNRIINTFFKQESSSWLTIKPLLRMAKEFEAQVSSWSAHLPPAMQHYETTLIIRAPHLNFLGEGGDNHVSRELSWAIDNRLLEMQTWLYQPFLYYLVHSSHNDINAAMALATSTQEPRISSLLNPLSPNAGVKALQECDIANLEAEEIHTLHSLIGSGIDCLLKTIDVRARGHRHHGLWYDLRSIMCASVILLAVVKSENTPWIPGGVKTLWGEQPDFPRSEYWQSASAPIGGKIGKVLREFDFWASEAPELLRYKEVLESILIDVRSNYQHIGPY